MDAEGERAVGVISVPLPQSAKRYLPTIPAVYVGTASTACTLEGLDLQHLRLSQDSLPVEVSDAMFRLLKAGARSEKSDDEVERCCKAVMAASLAHGVNPTFHSSPISAGATYGRWVQEEEDRIKRAGALERRQKWPLRNQRIPDTPKLNAAELQLLEAGKRVAAKHKLASKSGQSAEMLSWPLQDVMQVLTGCQTSQPRLVSDTSDWAAAHKVLTQRLPCYVKLSHDDWKLSAFTTNLWDQQQVKVAAGEAPPLPGTLVWKVPGVTFDVATPEGTIQLIPVFTSQRVLQQLLHCTAPMYRQLWHSYRREAHAQQRREKETVKKEGDAVQKLCWNLLQPFQEAAWNVERGLANSWLGTRFLGPPHKIRVEPVVLETFSRRLALLNVANNLKKGSFTSQEDVSQPTQHMSRGLEASSWRALQTDIQAQLGTAWQDLITQLVAYHHSRTQAFRPEGSTSQATGAAHSAADGAGHPKQVAFASISTAGLESSPAADTNTSLAITSPHLPTSDSVHTITSGASHHNVNYMTTSPSSHQSFQPQPNSSLSSTSSSSLSPGAAPAGVPMHAPLSQSLGHGGVNIQLCMDFQALRGGGSSKGPEVWCQPIASHSPTASPRSSIASEHQAESWSFGHVATRDNRDSNHWVAKGVVVIGDMQMHVALQQASQGSAIHIPPVGTGNLRNLSLTAAASPSGLQQVKNFCESIVPPEVLNDLAQSQARRGGGNAGVRCLSRPGSRSVFGKRRCGYAAADIPPSLFKTVEGGVKLKGAVFFKMARKAELEAKQRSQRLMYMMREGAEKWRNRQAGGEDGN